MLRPGAEHDSKTKTGLHGAYAPVDVLEGKEIVFVQQADSFNGSAVEHEHRARERRDGNKTHFVARRLSVGNQSHATPAQVDTHATRFDPAVPLPENHRPDRPEGGVFDCVREEPEAIGLQHGVAVEKEQSVTALRQKMLQSRVHTSGEATVFRKPQVILIRC